MTVSLLILAVRSAGKKANPSIGSNSAVSVILYLLCPIKVFYKVNFGRKLYYGKKQIITCTDIEFLIEIAPGICTDITPNNSL